MIITPHCMAVSIMYSAIVSSYNGSSQEYGVL